MSQRQTSLKKIIGGLCLIFDRDYVPLLVEVWDSALSDLAIEEIEHACAKWTSTNGKKFPVPAEIRELIQGDPKSRSHQALELLVRAMEKSGSGKSISFNDKFLIVAVEHYGGWPEICSEYRELRSQDQSYWEHNFREVYQSALRMGRKPRGSYLEGRYERYNSENVGSFTRGVLPAPEVEFYGISGELQVLALEEFNDKSKLVEISRKQLSEVSK